MRTELIALHGNMKELKSNSIRNQVQIYPHCFNLEIVGSGSATPEGVTFPGGYINSDPGLTFAPFMTYGNDTTGATEYNSKYVSLYAGMFYYYSTDRWFFHYLRFHRARPFIRVSTIFPLVHISQSRKPESTLLHLRPRIRT